MNNVTYYGHIATDLELKQTPDGIFMTTFRLAVKRPHKNETTDFFNIVAWKDNAEKICKFFRKGSEIIVQGYNTTREYNAKDGTKRTVTELVCESWFFLDKKGENNVVAQQTQNEYKEAPKAELGAGEDLPF